MNEAIHFIERTTRTKKTEEVYGEKALRFLYGKGTLFSHFVARIPWVSAFYGALQKRSGSRKKILPFIEKFGIDSSEFAQKVETFSSFDQFFTRKLKGDARPIASTEAIIPADGRFRFLHHIEEATSLDVKGTHLSLSRLLGDEKSAKRYAGGSLILGRLCPTDYHRFHFPFDCTPSAFRLINGPLYSVNPLAVRKNLRHLLENKRKIAELESPVFGKVAYIAVGATSVGSIHQTYIPNTSVKKGEEMGYFSFGGSALILLFEPGRLTFADDLTEYPSQLLEIRCLTGQSLGTPQKI